MSRPAGFSPWSLAPFHIIGAGLVDDPIPIVPPPNYDPEGEGADIFRARSKAQFKALPDWEILVTLLRAPHLVFFAHDKAWHREQWDRLCELRKNARRAAKDGDQVRFTRLVGAVRFRWRLLVQRSKGYQVMGGRVFLWQ
jgi:hypothetical protein